MPNGLHCKVYNIFSLVLKLSQLNQQMAEYKLFICLRIFNNEQVYNIC